MTPCDPCAMSTFAVLEERFGAWDWSRDLRDQDGFADHAAVMDALVDDGFIVLGGPVGEGKHVLLIVDAEDSADVQARLAVDPWIGERLRVTRIEPWTILLRQAAQS
jgi:hypothetical protein